MTYTAIVAELTNLREHSNAHSLQLATALGSQVVVGLDHNERERVIYFPTDGILSDEYCLANNLYPIRDDAGKHIGGGFFEPGKARVRTQNFRGEKSDGFVATIDSLTYTGYDLSKLSVGSQFSELNGHEICEKYFSPATIRAINNGQKKKEPETLMFPKHFDTKQWAYCKDMIKPGTMAYVTEKTHGTSHRECLALVEQPNKGLRGRLRALLGRQPVREWKQLSGSRNVILNNSSGTGFYGNDDFRQKVTEKLEGNLRQGEIVYGEIVGWASEQTPIMPSVSTKDLKKSDWFTQMFDGKPPKVMEYNYGCARGESEFYIYRIAHSDIEGNLVELSWPQAKARAGELGLKTVPDVAVVYFSDHSDGSFDRLEEIMELGLDKLSSLDHNHIQEGLCVRLEEPDGSIKFLKSKSYGFKLLENIIKTDDEYVDMEESS